LAGDAPNGLERVAGPSPMDRSGGRSCEPLLGANYAPHLSISGAETLLDVSRIASGRLKQVCDLAEPGGEVVERLAKPRAAPGGVPDDHLGRIFERFERASSTRHYGGMGLGLYVARQIAEAHGGTITAHNLPAGGACFTVRLPLAAAAETAT
jgi:hypothetical protein